MASLRSTPLVAIAVLALSATPAPAGVRPGDAAATHAYLEAKIAETHAIDAAYQAEIKALEELAAELKTECPGVLAGAPLHTKGKPVNQSATEITDELTAAVFGAGEQIQHPASVRFERTVRRLRWSNWRLTHLIHSFAVEQAVQSGLTSPSLCVDLRAWVASGYTAVSAATKRFLHQRQVVSSITLIESEPHEKFTFDVDAIIAHRLRPYENAADRALARKLPHGEAKITDPRLLPFFEAVGRVFLVLEGPAGTVA
jgi:hypothetical protein